MGIRDSPYACAQAIERAEHDGFEPLIITLSAKLSGTYQSACMAASEASSPVRVVDSGHVTAVSYTHLPIPAVLLCLLANGVPTPYGSIGIPTVSLAGLVGLDSAHLAFVQMVQLAPFYIVAPFLIVLVAGKVEGASVADRLRGVVVPTLAAGLAFTLPTMAVAAFVGPELSVVVGSICALAVTALLSICLLYTSRCV